MFSSAFMFYFSPPAVVLVHIPTPSFVVFCSPYSSGELALLPEGNVHAPADPVCPEPLPFPVEGQVSRSSLPAMRYFFAFVARPRAAVAAFVLGRRAVAVRVPATAVVVSVTAAAAAAVAVASASSVAAGWRWRARVRQAGAR